jgi:hypothetical protein
MSVNSFKYLLEGHPQMQRPMGSNFIFIDIEAASVESQDGIKQVRLVLFCNMPKQSRIIGRQ